MTPEQMAEKLVRLERGTDDNWAIAIGAKWFVPASAIAEHRERHLANARATLADALRPLLWEVRFPQSDRRTLRASYLADLEKWLARDYPAGLFEEVFWPSHMRALLAEIAALQQELNLMRQDNGWEDGRRAGLRQGAEQMRERAVKLVLGGIDNPDDYQYRPEEYIVQRMQEDNDLLNGLAEDISALQQGEGT